MDRRFSLILGLGLGALGGIAGCTPSLLSHNSTTQPPQTTESRKEADETTVASLPPGVRAKEKVLPRRNPKAMTCVAAGDFYLRESLSPERTAQDQKERRETAKRAYRRALELDPNCSEAHRGLAQAFAADRDHERAVSAYQAALKVNPRDAGMWFELGMCHSRCREWEPAFDALTRAADLDPENRQYAKMAGFCLARAGKFEQSLAYLTRVVGEAQARYHVGRMMLHLGQTRDAKEQLQLAVQQDPNLDEARKMLTELEAGPAKMGQPVVPVNYEETQKP